MSTWPLTKPLSMACWMRIGTASRPPVPTNASSDRQRGAAAQLGAGPPAPPHGLGRAPQRRAVARRRAWSAGDGRHRRGRSRSVVVAACSCLGLVGGPVPLVGLDQVAVAPGLRPAAPRGGRGRRPGRPPGRRTSSASAMVAGRLATAIVVMPVRRAPRPVRMRASVVGSRLEVASSRSRTFGRLQQGPGEGDALALPARQAHATLADDRLHAVGQLGHERRDLGQVEGHLQLLVAWPSRGRRCCGAGCRRRGRAPGRRGPGAASPPPPRPSRARTGRPARPGASTCRTRSGRRWPPSSPQRCRGRRRGGRPGRVRRRSGPSRADTPRLPERAEVGHRRRPAAMDPVAQGHLDPVPAGQRVGQVAQREADDAQRPHQQREQVHEAGDVAERRRAGVDPGRADQHEQRRWRTTARRPGRGRTWPAAGPGGPSTPAATRPARAAGRPRAPRPRRP